VGAFGVLLAFGANGTPAVVMSIVFAGAPVVNAIYALMQHPPAGGWGSIKPQFYLGIVLAAGGRLPRDVLQTRARTGQTAGCGDSTRDPESAFALMPPPNIGFP
jgi:hypothetical protein